MRTVVKPALAMSWKAVSISSSDSWASQYPFVPATMYSSPLSMNFWPEVVTKPVAVGAGAAELEEVGAAIVDDELADDTVEEGGVDAVEVGVAAPGRHS